MKKIMKIKWPLLLIAVLATCAGYVNKPLKVSPKDMHVYSWWETQIGRYYYAYDCTADGMTQGLDYDCDNTENIICTFVANPLSAHSDATGTYFYITDVPNSGINWGGNFILY